MGMKLKAVIMDDYKARMEQGYMRGQDVITLKEVPCEMKFIADAGWMEHENESHQYLPVFHLSGHVTEIRGNFPYNVSTLSFGDTAGNPDFQKDLLYYLTPDELTRLIQVGKFYTKKFQLPEILTNNEYSLPVLVDMMIVPPPRPIEYEQAAFENGLTDTSVNGIDKTNLPIFYIGFAGTGINRKKDKLLDYYGIDFDEDFPTYALTAESSGYTEPTLMDYLVEPVEEEEIAPEKLEEVYLTPEQEAALRKEKDVQKQETVPVRDDDYQMTDEDILLAEADKNIERRIELVRQSEKQEKLQRDQQKQRSVQKEAVPEKDVQKQDVQKQAEVQAEKQSSQAVKETSAKESSLAKLEQMMKSGVLAKSAANAKNIMKPEVSAESSKQLGRMAEPVAEEQKPSVEEKKVEPKDVTEEVLASEEARKKDEKPGTPQTFKAVDAPQEPVSDAAARFDNQGAKPEEEKGEEAGLDAEEEDHSKLADAQGADVSDTDLQRKIDEAKAREAARQTSVNIAQDRTEERAEKNREVSAAFESITEAAEAQETTDVGLGR